MFITLEGIEGAGKSTQMATTAGFLADRGLDCVVTREPGGTALGRRIRAILLDPEVGAVAPAAELLLYLADRVEHVRRVIRPALAAGRCVLCDRWADATMAYQGVARGVGTELVGTLHRLLLDDLRPDLTLLVDLPAEVGLARAWEAVARGGRSGGETRFEREALAFHQRVRRGYLELAAAAPERFCIIDGTRPPDEVAQDIRAVLADRLG